MTDRPGDLYAGMEGSAGTCIERSARQCFRTQRQWHVIELLDGIGCRIIEIIDKVGLRPVAQNSVLAGCKSEPTGRAAREIDPVTEHRRQSVRTGIVPTGLTER